MVQPLDDARRRRTSSSGSVSRVPPHNLEAEESLLGAMLLSRDAIVSAVELQLGAGDFYKPAHGHIYDAISSIYAQGEPADPVTVAEELRRAQLLEAVGGQPAIQALQANTPAIGNAARYARIVEEHALLRKLIGVAGNIAELGYSMPDDVAAAIDDAEAMVFDVAQRRVTDSLAPLRDLLERQLDRIEALFERGEDITGVPTGYVDLDHQLAGLQPSNLVIVGGRPGTGKALALDTPLPTPEGWTTVGDVQLGDEVLDEQGRACRVTFATPVQLDRRCYEVVFDDGSTLVADAEHQWFAYDYPAWKSLRAARSRARTPAPNPAFSRDQSANRRQPRVVTTEQMVAEGVRTGRDRRPNWYVPLAAPLTLPERPLALDPYLLGAWLGDGHSRSAAITSADPDIVAAFEAKGYRASPVAPAGAVTTYRITFGHTTSKPWLQKLPDSVVVEGRARVTAGERLNVVASDLAATFGFARSDYLHGVLDGRARPHADAPEPSFANGLIALGVLGNKHIPSAYLRGSHDQRRALLQGLLDTDGSVSPNGCVELCLANRRLLAEVRELVCSLGHRPGQIREKVIPLPDGRSAVAWRFAWLPLDNDVFRLPRKAKRLAASRRRVVSGRATRRAIVEIRPVPSVPVRCITVDSPSELYLAGESMIPTHNTSFALGIVTHAALESRTPVLLFSLEMSHLELTQRMLCSEARVDAVRMRNGRLIESDWPKISHAVGRLAEAPVFIDDNPHLTVMEIRAKARRLKSRSGLGLIVIDYLQLMGGRTNAENRQVEVSEISRGLKILARELEVPVVALSQLSRSLESRADKRPQLADLRESGCMPAHTKILRADNGEEVSLGELVLSQEKPLVWSVDDHQRLVPARLTNAFPSGIKPVFELHLASGRSVQASANHPFLTIDGWTRLDALAAGSFIAVPRRLPAPFRSGTAWPDEANKRFVERGAQRLFGAEARASRAANATVVHPEELTDLATSDLFWDRVTEIRPVGEQPTFDVTVEGTHNFIADRVVAHNSLEQDADVVVFLYRDEVYNRDSPDRGTAEVIVAKHRNGPTGVTQLAFLDHYTRFANMAKGV